MSNVPISPLPNGSHHIRRRPRNHKVKQPLRRRRNRNIKRPQSRRRDLRHVDPAHGAPSKLEEAREQEHADERKVARAGHGLALHGRVHAHVDANVVHGCALCDRGPEQGAPAAEGVGGEDEEAETADHFYDAVDALEMG